MVQSNPKYTCAKCRRFINPSLFFCPYCGAEINKSAQNTERKSKPAPYQSAPSHIQNKRSKIQWSEENPAETPDYSAMYDETGTYNPNYDGYYNDTLPQIANEIDSLLAGKEKTILKVIFSLAAIAAIIVYLVLTI